jgi:glycosyltransferase involved in cell wall biosynthesis
MMKIAYLIPDCGVSGGVAVVCQHANRLLARGHQVALISQANCDHIDWFPNQLVPVLPMTKYPEDLDILIATGWSTSFEVVDLPAKHKFYFVQSDETRFHNPDSVWKKLTALSYLLNFHYITEAQWIKKWLNSEFNHNAALIPNGLDQKFFFPDEPIAQKGERPRILLEGAIAIPYKGMEDAFKVVHDLDAEIWCVSSLGEPKPEWHCDRFFSQVPMEHMRRVYSSCDILLKMSRVEGFFGPPLEMMACGGAVVVGKVTGYDEYIRDGYNALVVEQGDVAGAREAINNLIDDVELRQKLINNGFETVKAWDWDASIDKLESYLVQILNDERPYNQFPTRIWSDRGIALSYEMAKTQYINYDQMEFSAFTEPVDRLFYRLRKIKAVRIMADIIYKIFKVLKRVFK